MSEESSSLCIIASDANSNSWRRLFNSYCVPHIIGFSYDYITTVTVSDRKRHHIIHPLKAFHQQYSTVIKRGASREVIYLRINRRIGNILFHKLKWTRLKPKPRRQQQRPPQAAVEGVPAVRPQRQRAARAIAVKNKRYPWTILINVIAEKAAVAGPKPRAHP